MESTNTPEEINVGVRSSSSDVSTSSVEETEFNQISPQERYELRNVMLRHFEGCETPKS